MPDHLGRAGGLLGRSRGVIAEVEETGTFAGEEVEQGWMVWPLIPYSYNTVNDLGRPRRRRRMPDHWLGTDDTARDVLARVIYGFRLSVSFALIVTFLTSVIGIAAGAAQGYYGGCSGPDLPAHHRDLELHAQPLHHHHHIGDFHDELLAAGVPDGAVRLDGLVGVVRAEFLRARNFEYVRAARALGVSNGRSCSATCCPTRWWRR
jgi:microcin C transport system permease protein